MKVNVPGMRPKSPEAIQLKELQGELKATLNIVERARVLGGNTSPHTEVPGISLADGQINALRIFSSIAQLQGWDDEKRTDEAEALEAKLTQPPEFEAFNKYLDQTSLAACKAHEANDDNAQPLFADAKVCLDGFARVRGWSAERTASEAANLHEYVTGKAAPEQPVVTPKPVNLSKETALEPNAAPVKTFNPNIEPDSAAPGPDNNRWEAWRISKRAMGIGAVAVGLAVAGYKLSRKHDLHVPKMLVSAGTTVFNGVKTGAKAVYSFASRKLKARFNNQPAIV